MIETRFLYETHSRCYRAFRSALAVTSVPTDEHVIPCAPGTHGGRDPRPRHGGSPLPPRSLQPPSALHHGRGEDTEQGCGRRHLMLENKLSSPVCQWPTREAEAALFQSFRVVINNGWNKSRTDVAPLTSRSQDAGAEVLAPGCRQGGWFAVCCAQGRSGSWWQGGEEHWGSSTQSSMRYTASSSSPQPME